MDFTLEFRVFGLFLNILKNDMLLSIGFSIKIEFIHLNVQFLYYALMCFF